MSLPFFMSYKVLHFMPYFLYIEITMVKARPVVPGTLNWGRPYRLPGDVTLEKGSART